MGGGLNFADKLKTAAATTVKANSYQSYTMNFPGSSNVNGIDGLSGRDLSWSPLELQHGFEARNVSWEEFFAANSTHRSSFYYDGRHGGGAGPIEFWHQPHPTKLGEKTGTSSFGALQSLRVISKIRRSSLILPLPLVIISMYLYAGCCWIASQLLRFADFKFVESSHSTFCERGEGRSTNPGKLARKRVWWKALL